MDGRARDDVGAEEGAPGDAHSLVPLGKGETETGGRGGFLLMFSFPVEGVSLSYFILFRVKFVVARPV